MDGILGGLRRRREQRRRRKRDALDCVDCVSCGDCSPLLMSPGLMSPALLAWRVLPGAFGSTAVDPWVDPPRGRLARVASRLVRSYQLRVSVPRARPVCSMTPSCSRYALQALSRHGSLRGTALVVRRLRRCGSGATRLDPVPAARS